MDQGLVLSKLETLHSFGFDTSSSPQLTKQHLDVRVADGRLRTCLVGAWQGATCVEAPDPAPPPFSGKSTLGDC